MSHVHPTTKIAPKARTPKTIHASRDTPELTHTMQLQVQPVAIEVQLALHAHEFAVVDMDVAD